MRWSTSRGGPGSDAISRRTTAEPFGPGRKTSRTSAGHKTAIACNCSSNLNLLLNAADAMSGSRTGRERSEFRRSRCGDSIQTLVQDSGVGLDPRGIGRSSKPFYTTKRMALASSGISRSDHRES